MNFSVEAEGIDFILRFRDEASDQINMAEKSYQRLVSAMQSLITTQRAFSDSTTETLSLASQALKNNPFPIATPLTISADQISLMAQFEGRATAWFQNMSNQMLAYINRVRRATTVTNSLRDVIGKIVEDIKNLGEGVKGLTPLLVQFAQMKLPELGTKGLKSLLRDAQALVKTILEWAKVSPEFRKAMKLDSEQLGQMTSVMDDYQKKAQSGNFHSRDLRDAVTGLGQQADKAKPKLEGLVAIFDKMTSAKYALAGILSGIAFGKGVQAYASLEDAAFAIHQKVGGTSAGVDVLIAKFRELSRDSGYSAQSIAGAFAMIAEKSGRVTEATGNLAVLATTFSKLTGTSSELAGEMSGDLVKAFNLSEKAVGEFLQMANQARVGSRGLMGPEFIQFMTQNVELMRKLAQTTGFGSHVDEFLKKNVSSMMALQKEFSVIYGDAQSIQQAIAGAVSIVGEDATKVRYLLTSTGKSYEEFVGKIRSGKLDEAFLDMAEAWQTRINNIPEENRAVYRRMFAQTSGIAEDQLNQLERVNAARIRSTRADLDDIKKRTEIWNKGAAEFRQTFSGIVERLGAIWSYFQMVTAPYIKLLLQGLDAMLALMTKISSIKFGHIGQAFDLLVGALITGFEIFMAARGVSYFFKLFGSGGIFKDIIAFFKNVKAATPTDGIKVAETAEAQAARLSKLRGALVENEGIFVRIANKIRNMGSSTRAAASEFDEFGLSATRSTSILDKFFSSKLGKYLFEGLSPNATGLLKYFGRVGKLLGGLGFTVGSAIEIKEKYEKEGETGAAIAFARFVATSTALFPRAAASIASKLLPDILVHSIIGRLAGRVIPYVGWVLLAKDALNVLTSLDQYFEKRKDSGVFKWARLLSAPFKELNEVLNIGIEKIRELMGLENDYDRLKEARANAGYSKPSLPLMHGMGTMPGGTGLGLSLQIWKWALEGMSRKNKAPAPLDPRVSNGVPVPSKDKASTSDELPELPVGNDSWQKDHDEKLKKEFERQKNPDAQPAAFIQPSLATPRVQNAVYHKDSNSDVTDALKSIADNNTGSDDVVHELKRIGALIELALRRVEMKPPMQPRFSSIAEATI